MANPASSLHLKSSFRTKEKAFTVFTLRMHVKGEGAWALNKYALMLMKRQMFVSIASAVAATPVS